MIAVHHGGAGPLWLDVLVAADEWGTPPWEIAGGSRLLWWLRWQAWKTQAAKKAELDRGALGA